MCAFSGFHAPFLSIKDEKHHFTSSLFGPAANATSASAARDCFGRHFFPRLH
jgi:hypothetical protein